VSFCLGDICVAYLIFLVGEYGLGVWCRHPILYSLRLKSQVPNDDNIMGPILKVLPNGTQKLNIFQNNLTPQDSSPVRNLEVAVRTVLFLLRKIGTRRCGHCPNPLEPDYIWREAHLDNNEAYHYLNQPQLPDSQV
jgi:hypothetical protein